MDGRLLAWGRKFGRWLVGDGPVAVIESTLPQTEIIKRAKAEIALETAESQRRGGSAQLWGRTEGSRPIVYVDGGWDGEELMMWTRPVVGHPSFSASLHITFEPSPTGTRLRTQVRYAPSTMKICFAVFGIGLLVLVYAYGQYSAHLPTHYAFAIGCGLLGLALLVMFGTRRQLSGHVPVLRAYLAHCS
ncbi:MAG TPA: hypothetical protein VGN81_02075 [Pseudonocardiaceae bacterium]|jgi:hypothetical protein